MIYLTAPGGRLRVVVIDTDEHGRLKNGQPLLTPDRSVMLAWTPDPAWLQQAIQTGAGTSGAIARAIDMAARRPQASALLGPDGRPMMAAPTETEEKTPGGPTPTFTDETVNSVILTILKKFPSVERAICSVPPAEWRDMVVALHQEHNARLDAFLAANKGS